MMRSFQNGAKLTLIRIGPRTGSKLEMTGIGKPRLLLDEFSLKTEMKLTSNLKSMSFVLRVTRLWFYSYSAIVERTVSSAKGLPH